MPTWIQRAIDRGLEIDPRARWPSMDALLEELARDPKLARRRALALALGVSVAAGGVLGYAWIDRQRVRACEREADARVREWRTRRAAIRSAFLTTGLPYADATADRVEPLLDRWAEAWTRARVDACLDGGGRADDEDAEASLVALRTTCLDRQAVRVQTLLPLLERPDAAATQHAVAAVSSLPAVSRCEDPTWLSTERRAAARADARVEHEAVYTLLMGAHAHAHTGAPRRGLEQAERALERARALADEALLAEALVTVGALRHAGGQHEPAAEALERAYFLAGSIGHQRVAVEAAVQLIATVGFELARPEEGLAWAQHAEMWIELLGLEDKAAAADYHNHLAMALMRERPEAALEHLERALAVIKQRLNYEHPDAAGAHNNIGYLLDILGRGDEALPHYHSALEIARRTLGESHPDVATARNNIAAYYLSAGELDLALEQFELALSLRRAALGDDHIEVADSLGNIGVAMRARGRHDEALERFRRSLEIRERQLDARHPDVALSLHSVGTTQLARGEPEAALAPLERSLEIRVSLYDEDHPEVAESRLSLGDAMLQLAREDEAARLLGEGVETYARVFGSEHPAALEGLLKLGELSLRRGERAASAASYERARAIAIASMPEDAALRGDIELGLARALWRDDDPAAQARATELARAALTRAREAGSAEQVDALERWLDARSDPAEAT